MKGGTQLVVTGSNLGKSSAEMAVDIDGKQCAIVEDGFLPTER